MTWATSVPILVFLGVSVLDLGPMYATGRRQTDVRRQTDKQTGVRQHHRLMPPPIRGGGIIDNEVDICRRTPLPWHHLQYVPKAIAVAICSV